MDKIYFHTEEFNRARLEMENLSQNMGDLRTCLRRTDLSLREETDKFSHLMDRLLVKMDMLKCQVDDLSLQADSVELVYDRVERENIKLVEGLRKLDVFTTTEPAVVIGPGKIVEDPRVTTIIGPGKNHRCIPGIVFEACVLPSVVANRLIGIRRWKNPHRQLRPYQSINRNSYYREPVAILKPIFQFHKVPRWIVTPIPKPRPSAVEISWQLNRIKMSDPEFIRQFEKRSVLLYGSTQHFRIEGNPFSVS